MEKDEVKSSVSQEQVQDLLFGREVSWQEIIYDLINTDQLDPWDVDIILLSDRFLKKIQDYEETDFFISSKVLLAASLLLRIKSEFLLNKYVRSIDDILFGSKEKKHSTFERIELDEEIPDLIPKSPMPRFRKVSLQELIASLDKAIATENRRIHKEIINKNALRETGISLPKRKYSIKDRLNSIQEKLFGHFSKNEIKKISYAEFVGMKKEERVEHFFPLLQMENNGLIWLHQEAHFEEIHIWDKDFFIKERGDPFAELREEGYSELSAEDLANLESSEEFEGEDIVDEVVEKKDKKKKIKKE
jgi:segregation and condensation protein A